MGVVVASAPAGEILSANQAAVEMFAYKKNIVKSTGEPYPVTDLPLALTLSTGRPVSKSDIFVRSTKGKLINVRATSAPLYDQKEQVVSAIEVIEEISDDQSKSSGNQTEFVSLASHQLRTPLTGVRWVTDLLLKGKAGKLDKNQKDFVQKISESNHHMINLVEDLLNVSHIDTGRKFTINKQPMDVVVMIDSLNNDLLGLANEHQVSVAKKSGFPKKLELNVDGEKIRQVFQNLLSNAVKYSKSGGKVEVGFDDKKAGQVTFSVKDSGLGIPKDQQSHIFEKFFRADNVKASEGTGLGLYIAKAIVEAHGGKLWFTSKEKTGTTFFVSLPVE